jgi:hypothetical protein
MVYIGYLGDEGVEEPLIEVMGHIEASCTNTDGETDFSSAQDVTEDNFFGDQLSSASPEPLLPEYDEQLHNPNTSKEK